MNKKMIFSLTAASMLAMASCSDSIDVGGDNQGASSIKGDAVYLTLNIKTPASSSTGTRVAGGQDNDPTGGENGDGNLSALEDENYVRSATIVLYTVDGATKDDIEDVNINTESAYIVASAYTGTVRDQGESSDYANHEYKATVQIESEALKDYVNVPLRILTIANANVTDKFPQGTMLTQMDASNNIIGKDATIDHHLQEDNGNKGRFVMSTHVEKNAPESGTGEVQSTVTFEGDETSSDKAASAIAWVERLSARIDYIGDDYEFSVTATSGESSVSSNSIQVATAKLLGLAPVNVAKHDMYIFKRVTEDTDIESATTIFGDEKPVLEIPDPYTSDDREGENYVIEPTTSEIDSKKFDYPFEEGFVKNLSWTEFWENGSVKSQWRKDASTTATERDRIICYAGENTMAVDAQKHGVSTGVVFKVQYDPSKLNVYKDETGKVELEDASVDGKGFYRVNNKLYDDLTAAEAELIVVGVFDENSTKPLAWLRKNFKKDSWKTLANTPSVETLKNALNTGEDLGYMAWLKEKLENVTELEAKTMNWDAFLESDAGKNLPTNTTAANQKIEGDDMVTIEYYGKDHLCYYPYWIRHANNGDPDKMGVMEFAIVRNNVYRLDVTGIEDLGMADPFDSPDKPDEGEDTGLYMKVNLYVKSWVQRINDNIILK